MSKICIFCGNVHPRQSIIDTHAKNSFLTSSFTHEQEINYFIAYTKCSSCGVNLIINNNTNSLLGGLNLKITYKEPTFHHKEIYEKINDSIQDNNINIVSVGMKNQGIIDYFLNNNDNIKCKKYNPDSSYDAKIEGGRSIVLMTRVLEHINQQEYLRSLVNTLKSGDILYLEILNFEKLYARGDYSFLWNERLYYPSYEFILNFFSINGLELITSREYLTEEPFYIFIFQKMTEGIHIEMKLNLMCEVNSLPLTKIYDALNNRMRQLADKYQSISFIGIGHKSLTLIDMVLEYRNDIKMVLYDGNEDKIGTLFQKQRIQSLSLDIILSNISELYIFSFKGDYANKIISHIKSIDPTAEFANINELNLFEGT